MSTRFVAEVDLDGNKIVSLADGTASGDAVNKGQLDAAIAGASTDDQTAAEVPFTPTGIIVATNVQAAIAEVATDAATALAAHTSDTTGAHAASAISHSGAVKISDNSDSVHAQVADALTNLSSAVTPANMLAKLLTVDTDTSGLNANTLQGSTLAQVQTAVIASIVDSAPGTLDTLNELAAALGDDPNFATTINTALGLRARKFTAATSGTSATQVITHNLNTRDVVVSVVESASPWEHVLATVESTTVNTVTVRFGAAITSGQYRVTCHG